MPVLSSAVAESLSPSVLVLGIIFTIPFYFVARGIYYAFIHPLAKVPGPRIYAFSQLPYLYHLARGDWDQKLKELHDHYGPVVRFAYNDVSFITQDAMKKIYGHKSRSERAFEKDPVLYKQDREHSSILIANNDDHRRYRRLLSHAFSEKALRAQEGFLQQYVDKLILKLEEHAKQGTIIDIVRWFNFATFDVIGDLAFGQSFGCLESGGYHPWVTKVFESVKFGRLRMILERLGVEGLAPILTPSHLQRSHKEHFQLSRRTVLKRLENNDMDRQDFMSYVLRHSGEDGMTKDEMAENSEFLIIAGSETTATLLSGTTYLLLTNPDKYDKLVKEIRGAFESSDEITMTAVSQLPYLIATFNEGLRMYPPVPSNLPRLTPTGGEVIEGFPIPEKTLVSVAHWATFQSQLNFSEPQRFVPERWLDDARYARDNKEILQPFSIGPRNCLGKNLAYAEMRLLFATLVWKFDLELMDDSYTWYDQKGYFLWQKGDLNVKLTSVR